MKCVVGDIYEGENMSESQENIFAVCIILIPALLFVSIFSLYDLGVIPHTPRYVFSVPSYHNYTWVNYSCDGFHDPGWVNFAYSNDIVELPHNFTIETDLHETFQLTVWYFVKIPTGYTPMVNVTVTKTGWYLFMGRQNYTVSDMH
jgi:hypothetical protein